MTPREFRQEQEFEFDHFQELTSTGIKPNYVNIELFAHEYHKRKLKLLGIGDVSTRYSYSEIEEILKSQIDYMIECVQDSEGTIDPSEDINDIETTLKVLKHVYNVC